MVNLLRWQVGLWVSNHHGGYEEMVRVQAFEPPKEYIKFPAWLSEFQADRTDLMDRILPNGSAISMDLNYSYNPP